MVPRSNRYGLPPRSCWLRFEKEAVLEAGRADRRLWERVQREHEKQARALHHASVEEHVSYLEQLLNDQARVSYLEQLLNLILAQHTTSISVN